MNKPLVTIIAISFNHETYITECIASLIGQSYDRTELIIIDDCSKDMSVDVISDYLNIHNNANVKTIFHDRNMGLCATLNEAIRISNGKYVQIIACDDYLELNKIEKQVLVMEELDSSYCLVYSDTYIINENGSLMKMTFYQENDFDPPSGNVYLNQVKSQFIKTVSALIRKDAIIDSGMYDETLSFEDVDMYLRLSKNYRFAFDNYTGAYWRRHELNMTNGLFADNRHLRSRIKAYEKHMFQGNVLVDKILLPKIFKLCEALYQNGIGMKHTTSKEIRNELRNNKKILYIFWSIGLSNKLYYIFIRGLNLLKINKIN